MITSVRFIPTCMGNADQWLDCPWYLAVHPHVHGEREALEALPVPLDGSSPRAWGTR